MIDFQLGFLTFIGLGIEEGKPRFGLTIRPNIKKYHSIENVEIISKNFDLGKLKEKYILSKLIGQEEINVINNHELSHTSKINPAFGNISTVDLNISQEEFEENVLLLFYELITILPKPNNDSFQWYVGELSEDIIEKNGFKYYGQNIYEGEVALTENTKDQNNKIITCDKDYYGFACKGRPNGFGKIDFKSGFSFYGLSHEGLLSIGSYGMDGKSQITARWIKSSRIGICIEEYGEGVVYYGFTKNQKKNGVGILMLSNGLIATGSWIENFIEGPMLSLSHLGTAYLGNCVHQVYSGFAEMYYRNYTFYRGYWDGGQYHNAGTLFHQHRDGLFNYSDYTWNHGQRLGRIQSQQYNSQLQHQQSPSISNRTQTEEGSTIQSVL